VFFVKLTETLFYIEVLAQAGVQFVSTGLDLSAQILERVEALQELSSELLLRRLGEEQRSC